jgi:4'-phosphopantetheinyl transferase
MNDAFPPAELPSRTEIHVWRIDLDEPVSAAMDLDRILSVDERRRADRFVFARDAARFRLGRTMLRMGLGWYLGKAPGEIGLTTGWRGKPRLAEASELHFNVTHCDGLGLIAFTAVGEVGIDVEAVGRDVEALDIANSNFTANEAAAIAAAGSEPEQIAVFLRFWTRKEAVLKAAGGGLLQGLDTVDVSREPPGIVEADGVEAGDESRWLVRDLEGLEGFTGAIAAPPEDWSIRLWTIRNEDAIQRLSTEFGM